MAKLIRKRGNIKQIKNINHLFSPFSDEMFRIITPLGRGERDNRGEFIKRDTVKYVYRKKRFASFPSPAGMSLPNYPWAGIMTS
jgi:hypothetical protein